MKTPPAAPCNLLGYNAPRLLSLRTPAFCNLLGYKSGLILVGVVVFALLAGPALAGSCCRKPAPKPAQPAPCCPTEKPTPPAPCCPADKPAGEPAATDAAANPHDHRELPPASFTRESLYQLDATFTRDDGTPFSLAQLRGKPVLVAMFFSSCNYACPMLVADLTRIQAALPPALRDEVAVVLVSFDVARDTPAVLKKYRDDRLLGAAWTLLHGDSDAVAELAALLGVKFKQESDGQFAHSNLITVLNREGEIVHQRAGLQGGLAEAAGAFETLK